MSPKAFLTAAASSCVGIRSKRNLPSSSPLSIISQVDGNGVAATTPSLRFAAANQFGAPAPPAPVSLMASEKLITVVADTRTPEGTQEVYGGPYPGGVVYASSAFIEKNPKTTQAVVNAFVRGLKWIASHSPDEIAKLMPAEYALGNYSVYTQAIAASKAMYSPDGRFQLGAADAAYAVLKQFNPPVAVAKVDLSQTYTNVFVEKALATK